MDGTKKNLIFGKEIEKLVRDSHNVIYFQYMLQLIMGDYPDGCLIISPGGFGLIFKNYLRGLNLLHKYKIINLNLSLRSKSNTETKANLKKIVTNLKLIINKELQFVKDIIFVDDTFYSGNTYLLSKQIISQVNMNFSKGYFFFNFSGKILDNSLISFIDASKILDDEEERVKNI